MRRDLLVAAAALQRLRLADAFGSKARRLRAGWHGAVLAARLLALGWAWFARRRRG